MKMYPNLEGVNECRPNSFFEQNCNQIFTKGPALTKEILGKVNSEIVPKKTYLFGREFKTKRILLTAGLCLLLSTSFLGVILTWFTNVFDNFVLSQLVLSNNSEAFEMWKKPPAKAIYNIYIFNYTNVDDYKDGYVDKFHLQQLGPYAYEETLERIDISFPTPDTISYREKRSLRFIPKLSKGHETDKIIVPNLAVIGGSAATKSRSFFTQLGFNALLTSMGEEAFFEITAGNFIIGYRDRLYDLAKSFLPDGMPEKMGLLIAKQGESNMEMTINNGLFDMDKYATVQKVDGREELDYFSGNFCNSVQGTDGALHPPKKVQNKEPLFYFFPQACRRMPLVFEKETTVLNGKVTAYQYSHPDDLFDSVQENPENECFCNMDSGKCNLKGVFNVTMCNFDAPMFISLPHFKNSDPTITKHFTGLNPNGDYKSYFKIHPRMGFTMAARNILQLNIQVQKAASVAKVDMFEDGMFLPVAVIEGILNDQTLPQKLLDTIDLVSFTVPSINLALKWGSLLTMIITLISLVLVLKRRQHKILRNPERLIRSEHGYLVG